MLLSLATASINGRPLNRRSDPSQTLPKGEGFKASCLKVSFRQLAEDLEEVLLTGLWQLQPAVYLMKDIHKLSFEAFAIIYNDDVEIVLLFGSKGRVPNAHADPFERVGYLYGFGIGVEVFMLLEVGKEIEEYLRVLHAAQG